jgi:hypothetical protein
MTIDNLLSAQVVTADGKVLTASASENDDLFWALRGGGGNFGVVTSFEFQAHPVATVLGGLLLYPRAKSVDVIRHFRDYMASAPDELTAYAALLHGPDGSPLVGVIPCYCGSVVEGERVLEPLRKFCSPIVDSVQTMPFPVMQSLLAPSFPDGNCNYWKSTLQRELPDDAISAIVEHANRLSSLSPLSFWNIMAVPRAEFREMPQHSHIAICCGTSCFLRSGPNRRKQICTASGPDLVRKCCGLFRRMRTCFRRSISKQRTSSSLHSVLTCHDWPPSSRNTIRPISSA